MMIEGEEIENGVDDHDEAELEYEEDVKTDGKHPDGEYSYVIKIPRDRVAALIGIKGKDKKDLEEYSRSKISVDSKEGDVTITGRDALKLYDKGSGESHRKGFQP